MKIHKAETVIRYHITFTPREAAELAAHPDWAHRIKPNAARHGSAEAMLTRVQINQVCDVLAINGRELMAEYAAGDAETIAGTAELHPEHDGLYWIRVRGHGGRRELLVARRHDSRLGRWWDTVGSDEGIEDRSEIEVVRQILPPNATVGPGTADA